MGSNIGGDCIQVKLDEPPLPPLTLSATPYLIVVSSATLYHGLHFSQILLGCKSGTQK